jgi:hypothetical protein
VGCRWDMWARHFSPLYLSGLGLACPNLVLQHVHALVTHTNKILSLCDPVLTRGEHECYISEVDRVAVGWWLR